MSHNFNSSTQKAETGRLLWAQYQSSQYSEFKASQGYRVKSYLKQASKQTNKYNFKENYMAHTHNCNT